MANTVHCVTNELLKNNFYYALSTASASNPTQLKSSDTGIADSGASGFYFAPGAHFANINSKAPTIEVEVANGLPVHSIASATLASVPSLPAAAMQGHVMPSFPHTLVGLGPFANQGCQIVFTKVLDPHGQCILKGWREKKGARLWRFPLKTPSAAVVPPAARTTTPHPSVADVPIHPSRGLDASDDSNQACTVAYKYGCDHQLAFAAHTTKPTFDPRSLDLPSTGALVGFYHACLGFAVKQTWLDAAKAGNFDTFDGLTFSNIVQYCPDADKTILGHLAQQRQNVRSTRPRAPRAPTGLPAPVIELSPPELASN